MTVLEALENALEALKSGGFPPGGAVYDECAEAVDALKKNARKQLTEELPSHKAPAHRIEAHEGEYFKLKPGTTIISCFPGRAKK